MRWEMEGRKHRAIRRKVERVRWLNENKGPKTSNTLPATMQLNMLGRLPHHEDSWERQFAVVPRH